MAPRPLRVIFPTIRSLHRLTGILADHRANIVETSLRCAYYGVNLGETAIDITMETRGPDQIARIAPPLSRPPVTTNEFSETGVGRTSYPRLKLILRLLSGNFCQPRTCRTMNVQPGSPPSAPAIFPAHVAAVTHIGAIWADEAGVCVATMIRVGRLRWPCALSTARWP